MAQYIYGRNAIDSLLDSGLKIQHLYTLDTNANDQLIKKALSKGIRPEYLPKGKLTALAKSDKHQGFYAIADDYKTYSLDELVKSAKSEYPLLIVLDSLEDPHNLGAILRSAEAIGADGIIYGKNRSVSLNSTVAKVSTGAINLVKVAEVTNISQTLESLKKQGYWVVAASDRDSQDYRLVDYKRPIALVVGSEGKGISHLVLEKCDYLVGLPMKGQINSLNASVAAGILMYAIDANRYPPEKVSYAKGKNK